MNDADTIDRVIKRAPLRQHGANFKAQVLQACRQPCACVVAIARQHGLNANVVYRWRATERNAVAPTGVASPKTSPSGFLAISIHPEEAPVRISAKVTGDFGNVTGSRSRR